MIYIYIYVDCRLLTLTSDEVQYDTHMTKYEL